MVNVRDVGPADMAIPVECKVHHGRLMTAFCTTCEVLLCSTCLTKPKHRQHTMTTLEAAGARVHAELAPMLGPRGVEDPLEPLLGTIDKVKETRVALAVHLAKQLDTINAQEEATIMRVKEDAIAKRDEITAAVGRAEAALKAQEAGLRQHEMLLRQLNDYTHALLAMVKGSELAQVGPAIKERIEEARNVRVQDVRPVVVPERFPHYVQQSGHATSLPLERIVEHPIPPWTMGRKGTPKAVYAIGRWAANSVVLRFDLRRQAWAVHPAKLPTHREGHAVTHIGSCVYAMGGWTGQAIAAMERLDLTKPDAEWTMCAPMSIARCFLAAASINGILYALGGRSGKVVKKSKVDRVERYDPATNAWTACAPMRTAVEGHAAVAFNDHIYVLGGVTWRAGSNKLIADMNR